MSLAHDDTDDPYFPIPRRTSAEIDELIQATKLCQQCLPIFELQPSRARPFQGHKDHYHHHDTYDSLCQSVDAGCRICLIISKTWDCDVDDRVYTDHLALGSEKYELCRMFSVFAYPHSEFDHGSKEGGFFTIQIRSLDAKRGKYYDKRPHS